MKKLMMSLLSVAMFFMLVGCSDGGKKTSIDLTNYPENFEEWTTKDVMKYFEDKGVFDDKGEQYIQVKNDPINPTPDSMTELGSFMDDDGMIGTYIYFFDPNTDSDLIKKEYENAKTNKTVNIVYEADNFSEPYPVAHMIGQFGFDDESIDQEYIAKYEKALDDLCSDMGVTKEY